MELSKRYAGKKFMWDGHTHANEEEALQAAGEYQKAGFEVEVSNEEDGFYVFTRREVKQAAAEGQP